MTTFRPNRHADDTAIDTALNALVTGEPVPPATTAAAEAILTHRSAMSALQHHTAATGPAAGTWDRVLRATAQPATKGQKEMSALALAPASARWTAAPGESRREGVRSFMRYAASVLVVGMLAFGSWFAISNQPANDRPEPRMAVLGLQAEDPGNGVCDVESLSVDEMLNILQDPGGYLLRGVDDPVSLGYSPEWLNRSSATNQNSDPLFLTPRDVQENGFAVIQSEFEDAQPIVEEYTDCLANGTQGQIWRLTDPISVQYQASLLLPVLTSESAARSLLPNILSAPAALELSDEAVPTLWAIDPDPADSRAVASSTYLGFGNFIVSPLMWRDVDGVLVPMADVNGQSLGDSDFSLNIVYGRSSLNGEWYVIGVYQPNNIPIWPE